MAISGRVVVEVPTRWRRRFWRWLRNINVQSADLKRQLFTGGRWTRWKWRCPPLQGKWDQLSVLCGGICGVQGMRSYVVASDKVCANESKLCHEVLDVIIVGISEAQWIWQPLLRSDVAPHATVIEQLLLIGGVESNPELSDNIYCEG